MAEKSSSSNKQVKQHEKAESSRGLNFLKWLLVLLIIACAVAGNIYFSSQYSVSVRAVGVIILVALAVLVAVTTPKGRSTWCFFKASRMEMRKVVWPTRQETIQMTLIVLVVVIITALIMLAADSLFHYIISGLILG